MAWLLLCGAAGWAPQLPRFSDQTSWPGWIGGSCLTVEPSCGFVSFPRCGSTRGSLSSTGHCLGSNQADLPTELPSQTEPPVLPRRWAEALAGISALASLLAGMWSTRSQCKSSPLLRRDLIPCGWALQMPPVIPMQWEPSGPPGKCPATLVELDVHLRLSFATGGSPRSRGAL